MPLRPEFQAALSLLVEAIARLDERGLKPPILVGGAAVELYTVGQISSGDFDLVTPHQTELLDELLKLGFVRPGDFDPGSGASFLQWGVFHPQYGISVQAVSGLLMDGRADSERVLRLEVGSGILPVIPLEDLIADRVAQAVSIPGKILDDMKRQAVILYRIAGDLDKRYLDKRIREECSGDASLATLEEWTR